MEEPQDAQAHGRRQTAEDRGILVGMDGQEIAVGRMRWVHDKPDV
jgi:hypothetical protein